MRARRNMHVCLHISAATSEQARVSSARVAAADSAGLALGALPAALAVPEAAAALAADARLEDGPTRTAAL